jgi:hypothetical protein
MGTIRRKTINLRSSMRFRLLPEIAQRMSDTLQLVVNVRYLSTQWNRLATDLSDLAAGDKLESVSNMRY